MKFTLQVVIEDDEETTHLEEVISLEKSVDCSSSIGLTLAESKATLKQLQMTIIQHQAAAYTNAHRCCPHCQCKRRIKGSTTVQYRTLFGIVSVTNQRLYHCPCTAEKASTFSVLKDWLDDHNSPELQYIEAKWASLMAYGLTVDLLKDVLPVNAQLSPETVRQHLHKTAHRQDRDLAAKPDSLSGCARDWAQLPKPGKPLTVGIDGGYVRDWHQKITNFEVIVGKSFSKSAPRKRLGFVQQVEENPRRRLMHVLSKQGMQANQQITFLSDGADNIRALQCLMYPESEHVLDWFHVAMRFTVLNQFAKGLENTDSTVGIQVTRDLASAKWYLWHGNTVRAIEKLGDCDDRLDDEALRYANRKKFTRHLDEMMTYLHNNAGLIPNYGEKWRYGETISTGFVESTVNEVVAKRMVKKQQMQWSHKGAHALLQTRTAVLNDELRDHFEAWYPAMKVAANGETYGNVNQQAA